MIRMTKPGRENCGKKGDFLQWEDMKWSLYGQSVTENIAIDEPCRTVELTPKHMFTMPSLPTGWIACIIAITQEGGFLK